MNAPSGDWNPPPQIEAPAIFDVAPADAGALAAMLDRCKFDINHPPPVSPPLFRLNNSVIATRGNLIGVQAAAKAGKTAFIGAMMASTMCTTADCLGVSSENPCGLGVLHFDCEQSPADHYTCGWRAMKRAGLDEPPRWLRSYCLTGMTLAQRQAAVDLELRRAADECSGIHSVILDGVADLVADLVADPNDATEAFQTIDDLHQKAIRHDTVFVCILHENPGSDIGKTRGHLGSQLERKAESNLRLVKDSNGVTVVYTERARHAFITKEQGPRFQWCPNAEMHVSTASKGEIKRDEKRERLKAEAAEVFKGAPAIGLSWGNVHTRIQTHAGLKRSGARRHFDDMQEFGIIRKKGENYELAHP